MYTICQISEMFQLPVSTLRYYDKEGLFPNMKRSSGIRKFTDTEIEALRVIECLKKTGMEIKDIKTFIEWCSGWLSTYFISVLLICCTLSFTLFSASNLSLMALKSADTLSASAAICSSVTVKLSDVMVEAKSAIQYTKTL